MKLLVDCMFFLKPRDRHSDLLGAGAILRKDVAAQRRQTLSRGEPTKATWAEHMPSPCVRLSRQLDAGQLYLFIYLFFLERTHFQFITSGTLQMC